MKKAAIYARYSSENQRDESIDAQIFAIEEYAKRNNIIIVATYIDRAKSATTADRPSFQEMIKMRVRLRKFYTQPCSQIGNFFCPALPVIQSQRHARIAHIAEIHIQHTITCRMTPLNTFFHCNNVLNALKTIHDAR